MPICPEGLNAGFALDPLVANAICSIRTDFGPVIRNGTGWLARTEDGSSVIVTAAHNLFHPQQGLAAQQVELFFGREGFASTASRTAEGFDFPQQFVASGALPRWDFGLIRVNALDPAQCRPIPLVQSTSPNDTDKLIVGYPDEDDCANTFMPYNVRATVFPASPFEYGYRGNVATYRGMSGGPHLGDVDGGIVSYGILVRGPVAGQPNVPRAVRFSATVLQGIAALHP